MHLHRQPIFRGMTEPCESAVRAWDRLMRAHQAASGHVEGILKAAGLPPLAWHDVLAQLERTGDCGCRPFALERELALPQYGTSRLLTRLEEAGLIERRSCPGDGRGQMVVITEAGRAMRRRMWEVYGPALQQAVGSRLTRAEAEGLAELLGRLAEPPRSGTMAVGPGAAAPPR
jgi:DNA-binding MarR family transcriptional regulator